MQIQKNLFVKTYGCQMNVYDSLRMQDLLSPFGYRVVEEMNDQTDMVILNTCHIREKAAEKVYSELGRVKKIKDARKKDKKEAKHNNTKYYLQLLIEVICFYFLDDDIIITSNKISLICAVFMYRIS
jgi:hypothetical protein